MPRRRRVGESNAVGLLSYFRILLQSYLVFELGGKFVNIGAPMVWRRQRVRDISIEPRRPRCQCHDVIAHISRFGEIVCDTNNRTGEVRAEPPWWLAPVR